MSFKTNQKEYLKKYLSSDKDLVSKINKKKKTNKIATNFTKLVIRVQNLVLFTYIKFLYFLVYK